MKKIAIIGRPNVGKSSFFNRLAKERDAITSDLAGTTRDSKKRVIDILGVDAEVVDTGGLDEGNELFDVIKEHSLNVAKKADVILYLVDGKLPPSQKDRELFYEVLKMGKDVALVVNKIDNDKEKERAWEFVSFGAKTLFDISVSHNRGVNRVLEWLMGHIGLEENIIEDSSEESIEDFLEDFDDDGDLKEAKEDEEDSEIRVAIIGRVNVGKSSLLNALVGEERSIVSSIAGTTIDPVDEVIFTKERYVRFVDTAGIRRRGKIDGIEKYALDRTEKMLERSDIAILVLDVSEGFVDLDEKIGGLIDKHKLGCIVVFNKWDIRAKEFKEVEEVFRYKFKYLQFVPIITASALTKRHVDKIIDKIFEVYANYSQRVSTSELNRVLQEAQLRHKIPSCRGKEVRIYYATQYFIKPPKIALVSNYPEGLHFSYKRYLVNFLRDNYNFEGVPITLEARKRGEKA